MMRVKLLRTLDKLFSLFIAVAKRKTLSRERPQKILVVKLSAMGDALCLMPSLRQLKLAFPSAEIDWLTTRRTMPYLFSGSGIIREIHLLPVSPARLVLFFLTKFKFLARYDLIIDFDQYYRISEVLALCGQSSAGFKTPLKGTKYSLTVKYDAWRNEKTMFSELVQSIASHYLIQCEALDPILPELLADFEPSLKVSEFVNQLHESNKPRLFVYIGSSPNAGYRRWPLERFMEVLRVFDPLSNAIIAGGPDEVALKPLIAAQGYSHLDYIGAWNLDEWMYIFREAPGVFLGNDAGLLHVAESQGLPIVGIFGPNISSKWGSINPLSVGLESDTKCRPCIKNYLGQIPASCYRGDVKCIDEISVHHVVAAVSKALERQ